MDLTAQDLNQHMEANVFAVVDGSVVLDIDALTGESLNLQSELAQSVFGLLRMMSEAAISLQQATRSYLPVQQNVTSDGQRQLRATIVVLAALSDETSALVSPLLLNGRPLTLNGEQLFL